jgi:hypothetical protein
MPFKYSCFISYRHATQYKGRDYVDHFVEELKAELELQVAHEVCRDIERIKGAEFYQEVLAASLCKSLCMVVLFWPTYFSREHTFCAREFKAMEALEEQRLKLLDDEAERKNGLIVIIALRSFELIPKSIRDKRICKDFEKYTMFGDMRRDPAFQKEVMDLSRYIADRVRIFLTLQADPFTDCEQFRLPAEQEILPWLDDVTAPPLRLPTRELPT